MEDFRFPRVEDGENDSAILGWKRDRFGGGRHVRKEQGCKGGDEGTHRVTVSLLCQSLTGAARRGGFPDSGKCWHSVWIVGQPEVMARIETAEITSGLPITRP